MRDYPVLREMAKLNVSKEATDVLVELAALRQALGLLQTLYPGVWENLQPTVLAEAIVVHVRQTFADQKRKDREELELTKRAVDSIQKRFEDSEAMVHTLSTDLAVERETTKKLRDAILAAARENEPSDFVDMLVRAHQGGYDEAKAEIADMKTELKRRERVDADRCKLQDEVSRLEAQASDFAKWLLNAKEYESKVQEAIRVESEYSMRDSQREFFAGHRHACESIAKRLGMALFGYEPKR
jgi:hypothetical protein